MIAQTFVPGIDKHVIPIIHVITFLSFNFNFNFNCLKKSSATIISFDVNIDLDIFTTFIFLQRKPITHRHTYSF